MLLVYLVHRLYSFLLQSPFSILVFALVGLVSSPLRRSNHSSLLTLSNPYRTSYVSIRSPRTRLSLGVVRPVFFRFSASQFFSFQRKKKKTNTRRSAPTEGFYHNNVAQQRYIERQKRSQMNPLVLTFTLICLYSLDFWAVALYRMMTYNTPI